jgi:hypothetical protein
MLSPILLAATLCLGTTDSRDDALTEILRSPTMPLAATAPVAPLVTSADNLTLPGSIFTTQESASAQAIYDAASVQQAPGRSASGAAQAVYDAALPLMRQSPEKSAGEAVQQNSQQDGPPIMAVETLNRTPFQIYQDYLRYHQAGYAVIYAIPEPSSIALAISGVLAGLFWWRRR